LPVYYAPPDNIVDGVTMRMSRILAPIAMGMIFTAGVALATERQERLYTPAELRSDFSQMYRQLQDASFDAFAYTPKRQLDGFYAQAFAQFDRPMNRFQAKIAFEKFAAKLKMGHARVESPAGDWREYLDKGGKQFPLAIRVVDGRVFVADNLSGVDSLRPGDELLAMNGQSMSRWLERTEGHVSAESKYMADSLMEYDFSMYLWVELGEQQGFELQVRRAGSAPYRVHVSARTSTDMAAARTVQGPMLDLDHPMREAKMLAEGVAYLRPGPFYNADAKTAADEWNVSAFRAFIDGAFESFARAHAKRLLIDLRGNPGGDNLFSDVMVTWFATRPFRFASAFKVKVSAASVKANADRIAQDAVAAGAVSRQYADLYARARNGDVMDFDIPLADPDPEHHFDGKVFVLIDRQSYSNTVAVAATVQDYQFGTILGEPTSDLATTYGAMEQFVLPITGLSVGYPKARIVRPSGDLRPKGVSPDRVIRIPVVQTPSDEVLDEARKMASSL
jgi:hypothetical protein